MVVMGVGGQAVTGRDFQGVSVELLVLFLDLNTDSFTS